MKNIPSAVGSALQNKDEELHFLFYSLLNQNDPQEMVVVQALLNPGNCPMIVFKDKYPNQFLIPPQLLGMTLYHLRITADLFAGHSRVQVANDSRMTRE